MSSEAMSPSSADGFNRLLNKLSEPTRLSGEERNEFLDRGVKLLRLSGIRADGDYYVLDTRLEGDDFCCQCGKVAPKSQFMAKDECPNQHCPRPALWDA